jgi:arsenite methyltransferase
MRTTCTPVAKSLSNIDTMQPEVIVTTPQISSAPTIAASTAERSESLFEHVAWLYAFCRERLFRDDTERIIKTLWQNGVPPAGTQIIELGCGPGLYSRNLAARFSNIHVTGVDRSVNQLRWARQRASAQNLNNCTFERVNVLSLPFSEPLFDVLIASRIFTVLPERNRAVAEMFRVLRPGGRCFIAEPRYGFWASIPLIAMWLLASVTHSGNGYCEPRKAIVLKRREFENLFQQHPWQRVETWQDGRYQYALCQKG